MSGRDVRNIARIMKRDLKASFSNPIVVIVLVAIIVLPSLYALLNIQACWNPYENTNEVQFAIANLDNGTSYEGTPLNVGNELVKELKDNDKFDWTFVTEEELRRGVHDGDYYAGIILPKNLSKDVISITTDKPTQAELEYVVNIKSNPVASKLTDSGANAVYTTLNAKIIEIINLAAYDKLGELQEGLSSGAGQLSSGAGQLQSGSQQISDGADKVSSGADDVSAGSKKLNDGADELKKGFSEVTSGAEEIKASSKKVEEGASQVEQGSEQLQSTMDPSMLPDGPIKDYAQGATQLANASGQVASGSGKLANGSVKLAEGSSKLASGANDAVAGSTKLADGSVELAEGSLSLAAGSKLISDSATQALYAAASSLYGVSGSLSEITGVNESLLGDYFFSPVKLDRNEIFPVDDYGSNVAPFYIVLSMWVGAVITCVMIKPGISEGTKYSPLEMYFGKLMLFVIMSILQALVTISGVFILGVTVENPLLFIFSAIMVSVIFMVLIYSLISALGQVGKGLGVILLVLQISGTGGIYPIEIMHWFFQLLYPYLPMTYAITLIREAQLGLVWSNYLLALAIIFGMGIATVIIAVIIKEKADKATHYFEERLEETGLF